MMRLLCMKTIAGEINKAKLSQIKFTGDHLNKNGLGAWIEFIMMEKNRYVRKHLTVVIFPPLQSNRSFWFGQM